MDQHHIVGTELSVSRVCLGTMTFGSQVDAKTAASMVDVALDRGVNFIDTANVYNGGQSEAILGPLLEKRRDRVVLASKVGIKVGDETDQIGLSPATIRRQIDESLRRLRTDYLDIYYLHQPDEATPLDETLRAVEQLVASGKVRHIGASNYAGWQVCQMLCSADRHGSEPVRIVQPMYNLLARGIEQEFLPMCAHYQLTTVVYNPLAGGLLTGKHHAAAPPAKGTRFDRMENYRDRYWKETNFQAVQELAEAAEQAGCSLISVAFRWLLHHGGADAVIIGASSLGQLQENLTAATQGPLPADVVTVCDSVGDRLGGHFPKYYR